MQTSTPRSTLQVSYYQDIRGDIPLPASFQALAGDDGDFRAMLAGIDTADTATYSGGSNGGDANGSG